MTSRRIRIGCDFTYLAEVDTPVVFQVRPRPAGRLLIENERWQPEPSMAIREHSDVFGNPRMLGTSGWPVELPVSRGGNCPR